MPLNAGTRLGAYEIIAAIGAGGMGEVYRARDTRLHRDIALKVLPELFALDPDRLVRFEREAHMLAALNHPNIAAIHGFEETNGVHALVMELVEGEELAQRIARGLLPLDEALPIAKQIAEALEAAHEHGIIHRDLKPANIKLRPDGTVKVLDFGLAKALEGDIDAPDVTHSPTVTVAGTRAGVILGTAAYMAPEQAKGTVVDRRADLFAFGAVLYEMLTGRRAFHGDTATEILASVLKSDPDWTLLPTETPDAIRRLLRRSLHKDRRRRLQTAVDALVEIEDALTGPLVPPREQAGGRRRATVAWMAATVALAVTTATLAVLYVRSAPQDAPETRTEIVTPATGDPTSFALSPDGRQIVFVASGDDLSRLWLRPLAGTGSQPLARTEGAIAPFWSPDSGSVGFFADGKLKRLDIGGGSPQVLANTVYARGGGAWNADGIILFAQTNSGPLFRIPASGGQPAAVTKLDQQLGHGSPQFLPDGRQFLFSAAGTPETNGIYLGSLDSGETRRLTAADTAGRYGPSGWLLWVRAGTLIAQRLDMKRRELIGDPVTVADPVAVDGTRGAFSVAATGLLIYRPGRAGRHQLTWFDRSGKVLGTLGAPDDAGLSAPDLSPDGQRVTVSRNVQSNTDIWLLDGSRTSRFTFDPGGDSFPIWSPDGSRIVFRSVRKDQGIISGKPSSGAGSEQLLLQSPAGANPITNDWSSDGRWVMYHSRDPQTSRDLWVLPMEGDRKPWVFLKTNFDEAAGQFSPDGRWVAYQSNESGRYEVYVRPFTTVGPGDAKGTSAGGQWQISTAGGMFARWRSDGKELYYIAPDARLMASPITVTGLTLEPGTPVALFQTRMFGGGTDNNVGRQYDVARDGRFLINTVLEDAAAPITLLQNWNPPAK